MELINIYTSWSGIETALFACATVLLIIAGIYGPFWISESNNKKIPIISTSLMVIIAFGIILINSFVIDNYTYYRYHVTDMSQLEQKVEAGYIVTDSSSNPVYTLRKGE